MWKTLVTAFALVALVAGCGDDDERAADVEAFCVNFQQEQGTGVELSSQSAIGEALAFFENLDADAPEEIEDDLDTLTSGLETIAEAFAESDGTEGLDALEAIEDAGDVSLDELSESATAVEDFALENCEDIEATG